MATGFMTRRGIIGGTLAATALGTAGWRGAKAQNANSVRIGVIQTLSGSLADVGRKHLIGAQIAAKQVNAAGGVDGRPIELVIRDDKFSPNDAIAALHELAGQGVTLILGNAVSTIIYGMMPMLPDLKVVAISPSVQAMDLTHEKFSRNFFRCAANGHELYGGQGIVMAKVAPAAKRWGAILTDYVGQHQVWDIVSASLKRSYQKAGKQIEVLDPVLTKVGTTDFHSAASQLVSQKLDALHVGIVGGEGLTFYQQARPFGLFEHLKAISDTGLVVQAGPSLKSQTPPNFWGACVWYYDGYKQIPLAQDFYHEIVAETKAPIVDPFSAQAHTGIMSFAAAVRAAKSTQTEAVISALETTPFDSIFGSVSYRKADHQLLINPGYLHIEPQDADPGFRVADFVTRPWQDVLEPASPGVVFNEG